MYVDSSAERITTAPTLLGSDLKLYLGSKTRISAYAQASMPRRFDLPPVWEHTRARVVLGEHVDGLFKALELELEGE